MPLNGFCKYRHDIKYLNIKKKGYLCWLESYANNLSFHNKGANLYRFQLRLSKRSYGNLPLVCFK